jgi:hypothetical protein
MGHARARRPTPRRQVDYRAVGSPTKGPMGPSAQSTGWLGTPASHGRLCATSETRLRAIPRREGPLLHLRDVMDDDTDGGIRGSAPHHPSDFRPRVAAVTRDDPMPGWPSARSTQRFGPVLPGQPGRGTGVRAFRPSPPKPLVDGTFRGAGGNRTPRSKCSPSLVEALHPWPGLVFECPLLTVSVRG